LKTLVTSYDVAFLAFIYRHVIDTRFGPSIIESNGILSRGEQHLPGPTSTSGASPEL
jgi:hypothetical protein